MNGECVRLWEEATSRSSGGQTSVASAKPKQNEAPPCHAPPLTLSLRAGGRSPAALVPSLQACVQLPRGADGIGEDTSELAEHRWWHATFAQPLWDGAGGLIWSLLRNSWPMKVLSNSRGCHSCVFRGGRVAWFCLGHIFLKVISAQPNYSCWCSSTFFYVDHTHSSSWLTLSFSVCAGWLPLCIIDMRNYERMASVLHNYRQITQNIASFGHYQVFSLLEKLTDVGSLATNARFLWDLNWASDLMRISYCSIKMSTSELKPLCFTILPKVSARKKIQNPLWRLQFDVLLFLFLQSVSEQLEKTKVQLQEELSRVESLDSKVSQLEVSFCSEHETEWTEVLFEMLVVVKRCSMKEIFTLMTKECFGFSFGGKNFNIPEYDF